MDAPTTAAVEKGRRKAKRRLNPAQLVAVLTGVGLALGGRIAPRPASKVAMRLLFSPIRTRPSTAAARVLEQASTEQDRVDGNTITYYLWGSGERRVLLMHGWSGNAGQMTALGEALVAAGFAVIAVDLPGHGRSEGKEASVVHFARVIEAADRRFGPFHGIVSHSLSAAATTYALSRGVGCQRAVFVNPVSSYESVWRRSAELLRVSSKLMRHTARRAEQWLEISFADLEPVDLAPALSSALLVVHDKHDRETPITDSEALVGAWPDARLVTVEKLGHTRVLADEAVVRRVVEFVAAVDGAPGP